MLGKIFVFLFIFIFIFNLMLLESVFNEENDEQN